MISFYSDYCEGAHPRILKALNDIQDTQFLYYGEDVLCTQARELIRKRLENEDVDVHFFVGGIQANMTFIAAALRPHQAVISASSGHVAVHEAGAIETTGHKVIEVPEVEGKLTLEWARQAADSHFGERMVAPAMLFLSLSTERGTIYTKAELAAFREFADKRGFMIFIDGARLGAGLSSAACDLTLADLPKYCDGFTIGATKNGAFCGEALIIVNDEVKKEFRFHMRQRGALLAKGWFLGVQFQTLLQDDLYFELAAHANDAATRLQQAFVDKGIPLISESATNQVFVLLSQAIIDELSKDFIFYIWKKEAGDNWVVRFVTSWATKEENLQKLIHAIEDLDDDLIAKI